LVHPAASGIGQLHLVPILRLAQNGDLCAAFEGVEDIVRSNSRLGADMGAPSLDIERFRLGMYGRDELGESA
jgi:hypothetical protein